MTDSDLVRLFRSGDARAFAQLIDRHVEMVYRAAVRQVGRDAAEDLVQGVFLLLAQRIKQKSAAAPHGYAIAGWLIRATHFAALAFNRGRERRRFHEEQAMTRVAVFPPEMEEPSAAAEFSELRATLDRALAGLPLPERTAIALRFLEGNGLREVADAMGITEAAAGKRVQRGLFKLRRALGRGRFDLTLLAVAILAIERRAGAMPIDFAAGVARGVATAAPQTKAVMIAHATVRSMRMAHAKVAGFLAAAAVSAGIIGGTALVVAQEKAESAPGPVTATTVELPAVPAVRKSLEDLFARRLQAAGAMSAEIEMEQLPSNPADLPALRAMDARSAGPDGTQGSRMVTTSDDVAQRHFYFRWSRASGDVRQERVDAWQIKPGAVAGHVGERYKTAVVDAAVSAEFGPGAPGQPAFYGTLDKAEQGNWDWSYQTPFKMGLGYGRVSYARLIHESPVFEVKNITEGDQTVQAITVNYPGGRAVPALELHVDAEGRVVRMRYDDPTADGVPSLREDTIYSGFENHPVGGVDVWLPREMVCQHSKWSALDKRFLTWMTELVHVKSVAVNQTLPPEQFHLTFPADCKVNDATRDLFDRRAWLDTTSGNARMDELRAGKE